MVRVGPQLLGRVIDALGRPLDDLGPIHGLQEVGVVGLTPVPFVELPVLGIFADAGSLIPQLVLGCAALWWWRRSIAAPRKPSLAT